MPKGTETKHEKMDGIEGSIALWKQSLTVVALILMATAAGFFWIYLPATGQKPETSPIGNWGAFGDFIGGLLNPLVAFAAFYWLTQSVKTQKEELVATRETLDITAKAQEQQVQNGYTSIRLAAATAIVNTLQSDIGNIERELERSVRTDTFASGRPNPIVFENVGGKMALQEKKSQLITKRDELISEMSDLMSEAREQSQPKPPV